MSLSPVSAAWRLRRVVVAALLALCIGAALTQSASAAPIIDVETGENQYSFEVGGTGQLRVLVRNSGDGSIPDGDLDVTATLPGSLHATTVQVGDPFGGFPTYSCTISDVAVAGDKRLVTCEGPNAFGSGIAAGRDACLAQGAAAMCPIRINVAVDQSAPEGDVTTAVEACGVVVTPCGTETETTGIHVPKPLGTDYGAAPINGNPDAIQGVPAIPSDHAFWAGACDRSAAPGFGVDLATVGNGTGTGVRPSTVLAGLGGVGSADSHVAVAASPSPDHCLDPGSAAAYAQRSLQGTVWQAFPWDSALPFSGNDTFGQDAPAGDYSPQWRLPAETRAGSHPDGSSLLAWNRNKGSNGVAAGSVDGSVDNIFVDLPPGVVGNPQALPRCTNEQFRGTPLLCPPETQVGVLRLSLEGDCIGSPCNLPSTQDTTFPVYNLEPRAGKVAELGFANAAGAAAIRIVARARTNGDFGVTGFVGQIPAALVPLSQEITLWGVPWAAENDVWRAKLGHFETSSCKVTPGVVGGGPYEYISAAGVPAPCQVSYDPSWGPIRPFFSAQTECAPQSVTTTLRTDSFQNPGPMTSGDEPNLSSPLADNWKTYTSDSPPVTDCDKVPFDPAADFAPTSTSADSATGLDVDIDMPQNNDPPPSVDPDNAAEYWQSDDGLATAHLDKTVVTLPEGMSVNPSAAAGLVSCSDDQMGVTSVGTPYTFDNSEPDCPDGSHIGTAEATTPLLEGSPNVTGEVVLGTPKSTDPTSGQMFRLFLVLRNRDRGLVAKIHGTSTADPQTGQIVATFDDNPRVPVENIKVRIKGGDRGVLAMPQTCGERETASVFTPWTAAHGGGGTPSDLSDPFTVDGNCAFGFSPSLQAGMSTQQVRAHGALTFRFGRNDGERWIDGLTATLPTGLLAKVKGLPLCESADAAAGNCPASSRIGSVDASAGSGTPFVLEKKGDAYLTRGYRGCSYGLMVRVPVEAGPFRGDLALSPIVVRQAVCVDRTDGHVTAISDPLPIIHHGILLRTRSVTVTVDRPEFSLNPSDCAPKQIAGDFKSPQGSQARQAAAFQVSGCRSFPFSATRTINLTGKKQVTTAKHPGVRAQVTQGGIGVAGIEHAVVRLPKSLALDPNNAQALCEFADGTKPDPENHCPDGSIIGRARAVSPLLNEPLVGNVYFVKNIRRDPVTGNEIRTLPMLIVALRGEIAINLKGDSSTTKSGKLVNTFANVPDAPISQFNLNIEGGRNGILAVTRTRKARINLCTKPRSHIAQTEFDGHNGKRDDRAIRLGTPCPKKSAAKRAGKRR